MPRRRLLILLLLAAMVPTGGSQTSAGPANQKEALQRASAGMEALQRWYEPSTGLYRTTGWWNSANAVTVFVDFLRASGSPQDTSLLRNTFRRAQIAVPKDRRTDIKRERTGFPGFVNRYYDDEGWWALAWIDAYDLAGDRRYLAMAQSIFADMAGGWDSTCGGGIWWSKDRTYKNAIANELFFSVAAHLALRARPPGHARPYRSWADQEWQWFQQSGMINADHLINDGLILDPATGLCHNNGKTTWTYNQGVILGALAEHAVATHDTGFLLPAREIASAAIDRLTGDHGILHDTCEPQCGEDGVQFKGIFVRNLAALNRMVDDAHYTDFIANNAQSIWTADQTPDHQFGVVWSGPPSSLGAAAQVSAVDALLAATPAERSSLWRRRNLR